MKGHGKSYRGIVLVALVLCVVSVAWANDEIARPKSAEAREHLTSGTRLYRLREFARAIEEYKAGALREDAAVFYYNLGQCYRQLGRYDDAIWHYERFLDRASPLPEQYRLAVEGFIRDMKAERERRAMSRLPTEPAPDGALAPEPSKQAMKTGDVARAEPWHSDTFGWGLAGAGLVASGVSVGLLINAKSLESESNAESRQSVQDALRDKAGSRRLAGAIIGIGGGAALLVGIVKLVVAPTGSAASTTSAGLDVGVSPSGVMVMGRF